MSTGRDGEDRTYSTDFQDNDGMNHTGVPGDPYASDDTVRGKSMGDFMDGGQMWSAESAPANFADRYREPDDMFKGISFTDASSWSAGDIAFACDGDPFREAEVTRGVMMDPEALFFETDDIVGCVPGMPTSGFSKAQPEMPSSGFSKKQPGQAPMPLSNWQEPFYLRTDEPSPVPTHAFFKLNNTTIQVVTNEPWKIGNELLTFLRDKSTSDILKPNEKTTTKKYSIKAHVFAQPGMCTMKIKVYQDQPRGTYSIEFQRRNGDSIGFTNTYMAAAEHLKDTKKFEIKQLPKCALQPLAPPPPREEPTPGVPPPQPFALRPGLPPWGQSDSMDVPPPPMPGLLWGQSAQDSIWNPTFSQSFEGDASWGEAQDSGSVRLAPLLDMADMNGMSKLQAEAAMALADLTMDAQALKAMCTEEAFDKMKTLFANAETAVAYPTAKLFHLLASSKNPKVQELFSQNDIRELISQKAESTENSLVKKELMQVASCCGVELSKKSSFGQSGASCAGFVK